MKILLHKDSLYWSALSCLLILAGSNTPTHGHGAGGDIALFSTNGQVDVGFAILDDDDITQEFFDPDENVFSLVLLPVAQPNPIVPWDFGSSEPGFDANEGELPPEADISYNLLDLWYWDGADPNHVNFTSALGIQGGTAPRPEKSFASGGFHSHPLFGVARPQRFTSGRHLCWQNDGQFGGPHGFGPLLHGFFSHQRRDWTPHGR